MSKICITATIEKSFPKALVVFRGLENSFRFAKELGYDGLELALFRKDNVDVGQLKGWIKQYDIAVPVISTGQMYSMQGVWFTHPDKEVRSKAVSGFKGIVEVAAELGADVNVSRVRGSIDEGDSYQEGLDKLTECLVSVCDYADQLGIRILLEQMNRYETNYLCSALDVSNYINQLNIKNLYVHADLFHMNIEDADICKSLKLCGEHLGFIHMADSNRLAPGKGHLNFESIMSTLKEINYEGWLGVEVLTYPDAYSAAKQSIAQLKTVMSRIK